MSNKVIVTGGAGFIGTHLVKALLERDCDVTVFDNLKRARRPTSDGPRFRFVEGDIRDFHGFRAILDGASTIYHLAAQSNVMGAVDDPDYSITTNVLGTFNVLRAAADSGKPRVVFTSSREVYGDAEMLPVAEDHPLLAKNAYGASKVAGEAYCRTFAETGLPVEIVRLANVYGAGDSGRVIPLWLSAAQAGRDLQVHGGQQVIDFLWVGTAVSALLHAADNGLPGPVNIGSGVPTKIFDLAERVVEVTRSASQVVRTPARDIEVARFVADTTRMRALGLVPEADPLQHLAELVYAYPAGS